jgi:Flp pilus assembly protein protease CpaA
MLALFSGLGSGTPQVNPTVTIAVVIAGLVLLAAYDLWKQTVEDWAIVALTAIAIVGLGAEHISLQQWVGAVLSAAVTFLIYLHLGTKGVMGGGDVKLSVVPGLVLGAANPLLGIWWVAGSIAVHQVFALVVSRAARRSTGATASVPVALPHVPAMAVGMLLAVTLFPVGF